MLGKTLRKMLALAAILVALSCGRKSGTQTVPGSVLDGKGDNDPNAKIPPSSGGIGNEGTTTTSTSSVDPPAIAPEAGCARVAALKAEGCAWANRFPPEFDDPGMCMRSLENWFADSTEGHEHLKKTVACWALDCESAAACMVRANANQAPTAPRNCGEEGTTAIYVDGTTWERRRGKDAKRFSDVKTTEQEPVELCGVDGEVAWVSKLTCNGGKHPYPTEEAANGARDSYMARGGKCNSILDRYTVACPEATYTIHIDRYVCPMKP